MTFEALKPGATAVVTGGASGIGLAAAKRFAARGVNVCLADLGTDRLAVAAEAVKGAAREGAEVMTQPTDVASVAELEALRDSVAARFGGTDILMNNAGVQPGSTVFGPAENWQKILAVNLIGVINGVQTFAPAMIERGRPGLVINTGSKQGITTPPGDPAYNVSKAGVKVFTEALAHDMRANHRPISVHLLIPGFVFTPLAAGGRTEKPDGAWTPDQTADFMMEHLAKGDFYILCPDNDVSRALDERRILWAAGDIVENRSTLSRWDPKYADAFAAFSKLEP